MKQKTSICIATLMLAAASFSLTTTSLAQDKELSVADPVKQLTATTTLMDSIPDIIFYKDLNGVYRGGNNAWARLAGKPKDQLIGKTDLDLFPGELGKSFQAKDRKMLASRQTRRNEEWVVYPDGRRALLDTLKAPWLDESGKVLGCARNLPRNHPPVRLLKRKSLPRTNSFMRP
jgi:PAS domain S-box-containing protein